MTIRDQSSTPQFGEWKHKKSGNFYEVTGFGIMEASVEPCVIYKSLKDGSVWIRPCVEFFDGRFERIA